ncbi:MAG: SLBB domain-containing protein [Candidatus Zipacnadales bacterium]
MRPSRGEFRRGAAYGVGYLDPRLFWARPTSTYVFCWVLALLGELWAFPAYAEAYRLEPGDVIGIIVQGEPALSSSPEGLTIGPDGCFSFPYAGIVEAAGKTCSEVADAIRQALIDQKIVIAPHVTVYVVSYRLAVTVLGFVQQPGRIPIYSDQVKLSEALAAAGGVMPDIGDPSRVIVTRADRTTEEVDLQAILRGEVPEPLLHDGDTVSVPRTQWQVTVAGFVRNPGVYPLQQGDRVSTAIARAGGGTFDPSTGTPLSDETMITLIRADGTTLTVNAAQDDPEAQDPLLKPGDAIYLPESRQFYSVLGLVANPGCSRLRPGDKVSDALARCGGPLFPLSATDRQPLPDLQHALLYRADGTVMHLDLRPLFERNVPFDDLPLQAGDVLVIPETRNQVLVLGYVKSPGNYEFRPGDTVRTALAMAGDVLTEQGSANHVVIRHADGTKETLDLEGTDPPLQPGDQVNVPFHAERVTVIGRVMNPGMYNWHEGDRVVDMLAQANGQQPGANVGGFRREKGHPYHIIVLRRINGEDQVMHVDLRPFLSFGDWSANPEVQPGDVVFVPPKGSFDLQSVVQSLLLLWRSLSL